MTLSQSFIDVANGGSQTIYFALHDFNYNRPVGGTTLDVKFTGSGSLTGSTKITYLDSNSMGTPIYAVTISDDDAETVESAAAELEFSYTWLGNQFSWVIGGTTE
ncbi:MAG: hypothetical protein RQ754_15100 [Desulfuromonadales bacterium]|nr:hypothetical protein [Desulfuromonadales bacterium]